jgi:small subunit ribosomal protein S16
VLFISRNLAAGLPESRPNRSKLIGPGCLWNRPEHEEDVFMSASIRLKRFGTKKRPYYRIVVMDSRAPRDGKTIEELGFYHPIEAEEKQISFDADKVKLWIDKGAAVSDTVRGILNKKSFSLK